MLVRAVRFVAVLTLALSGGILGWRALVGPFEWSSLRVISPLNAQCIFGLSATVLLLLNNKSGDPFADRATGRSVLWLLVILLVTGGILWEAVRFPLVFDDYTLARYGQDLRPAMAKDYFMQPGGDGFFRPIGYLSFGLDALWSARDPVRWHLTGLVLHLANTVLAWLLASRIFDDRATASWTAALFALHGTVLLTPTYLAARFDVLSAFFVLAGLVLFLRYLDAGSHFLFAASLVCLLMGLFTKEIAFCFPFLATLVAGKKARSHWRALTAIFVLAAIVFAYRYRLFGGIGGYRDRATGVPTILMTTPLAYLKGFALRIWSAFYFPINWSHEPEPWLVLLLLAYLGVLGWMTMRSYSRRSSLMFGLAFTGIALLPIAHMLLVDASLLSAGRFYLALAGFAMFLGVAVRGTPKPIQALLGAVLLAFQMAALLHNLTVWGETATLADRTCAAAARLVGSGPDELSVSGLPREIDGVPFLANGFAACVAFHQSPGESPTAPHRELQWDPVAREVVAR